MRLFLIAMITMLTTFSAQAQTSSVSYKDMEMRALQYRQCIDDRFGKKRKNIEDDRKLQEEVLQSCLTERKTWFSTYMQLTGGPADVAETVIADFQNKFFAESKARHDNLLATFMRQISNLRGVSEFCPSAIKEKAEQSAQKLQLFLPQQHAPFQREEFYTKQLASYYETVVTQPIAKIGATEWCRQQRESAERAGSAKDYFK